MDAGWEGKSCVLTFLDLPGIGKNLALLEMNKTLPLLFRDYELELLKPQEDLKYRSTFFVVQHGLDVKISKRNRAAA